MLRIIMNNEVKGESKSIFVFVLVLEVLFNIMEFEHFISSNEGTLTFELWSRKTFFITKIIEEDNALT